MAYLRVIWLVAALHFGVYAVFRLPHLVRLRDRSAGCVLAGLGTILALAVVAPERLLIPWRMSVLLMLGCGLFVYLQRAGGATR